MAVAYVRDTGRITGGGVDSASGSFAALPAAGNAVQVLYSVWRSGGATISAGGITDNQSNTYSKADEGAIGNVCAGIFYDEDIGSPSGTFTVTINPDLASAYIEAVAIESSGVADSASLDQHTNATGNSSAPTVSTPGATAQADEFAVGALVVDDGSDAGIDTSAGWTTAHIHQSSGDTISAYQAYRVLSATGTQTFDGGTLSSSVNWAIVVATFKGAASGASGTISVTEANDTQSASGTTTVVGTSAVTDAADTLSATGATTVTGALAVSEAADTISASGSAGDISGTVAATEADDTSAASGTTTIVGSLAVAEEADVVSSSGLAGAISGSIDVAEADDLVVASGVVLSIEGRDDAPSSRDLMLRIRRRMEYLQAEEDRKRKPKPVEPVVEPAVEPADEADETDETAPSTLINDALIEIALAYTQDELRVTPPEEITLEDIEKIRTLAIIADDEEILMLL